MAGMTETERALRDGIASAHASMTKVMEKMDKGETLTVEDRKTFDDANKEIGEKKADLERFMSFRKTESAQNEDAATRGLSRDENEGAGKAYQNAWMRWLCTGRSAGKELDLLERAASGDIAVAGYKTPLFGDPAELRRNVAAQFGENRETALGTPAGAGVDGAAGYLIPQGFWQNLQIAQKAYGGLMGNIQTLHTATGQPLPWPTTDPTAQVGYYLTENVQASDSATIKFGQGMLHAWTIVTGPILASLQLINDSAFDVDGFVTARMAERLGRKVAAEIHGGAGAASSALTGINPSLAAWDQVYTPTGTGATGSPAQGGYYTPNTGEKVNTLGDYSVSGTPAVDVQAGGLVSFQTLVNMRTVVDPAYRQSGRCVYVMNDVVESGVRSLSDGMGHPLWQPNVTVGPDTGAIANIEGHAVVTDQNSPDISTSVNTAGGVLFGDFQTCMVLRVVDQMGTMRLTERYADYLEVGFIGFERLDLLPNDLRAVAQLRTAAATS